MTEKKLVWYRVTFLIKAHGTHIVYAKDVGAAVPAMPYEYRVCDDDDVVFFWGRISDYSSFMPLDWDGVDYGATYIEYKNPATGKYEML